VTDTSPGKRRARSIHLAPLGRHSRYLLASYLRHIFMVIAALMTVALTIDLWPQIPLLIAGPPLQVAFSIARLASLRICDLLPPFVPFATFLGVFWSEVAFTMSQERMLIWNSGRSPIQCLTPAIMAGVLMGAGLFLIDAYLRPAAIAVQIGERFGREGRRLDRSQSGGVHWIALPDGLLRAEIEYGPPLKLHNATIYKFDSDGLLEEVDTAALAMPDGRQWLLRSGRYWKVAPSADAVFAVGDTKEEAEIPFSQRRISLKVSTLWLGNLGMSPQYLALPVLRSLAQTRIVSGDDAGFKTRLQALYAEAILPGVMALLAAALAMLLIPYSARARPIVGVLLAGYLAHFSFTAFLLMGEFGYVRPMVGAWFVPAMLLLGTGGVVYAIQRRRGLGVSFKDTPVLGPAGTQVR